MGGPWELTKSGLGLTVSILCILNVYHNLWNIRKLNRKQKGFASKSVKPMVMAEADGD